MMEMKGYKKMSNVQKLINQKNWRFEGESGVRNLCRLVRAIGYQDSMHFGQFDGACYGDLINFLEDNPGACDKIIEFIEEFGDWEEIAETQLEHEEEEN